MSSADSFKLDESKILSSDKGRQTYIYLNRRAQEPFYVVSEDSVYQGQTAHNMTSELRSTISATI